MKQTLWKRSLSAFLAVCMLFPSYVVQATETNPSPVELKAISYTDTSDNSSKDKSFSVSVTLDLGSDGVAGSGEMSLAVSGVTEEDNTTTYTYKITGIPTPTTTVTTQEFDKWTVSGGTVSNGSYSFDSTDTSPSITLTAVWKAVVKDTVTIKFNANGGTLASGTSDQTFTSGGKLTSLPTEPTRQDYDFDGWYESDSFTGSQVTTSTTFSQNTTLYAKWTAVAVDKGYTITFKDGTDELDTLVTSVPGTTGGNATLSTLPTTNPTKTGYTFKGWYTSATGGTEVTTATTFDKDTTVYAQWTTAATYTVTFDANGGTIGTASSTTATTGTDGTLSTQPSDPTRTGYTFLGWYTAGTGGTEVTTDYEFTKNTTVYAQWSNDNEYTVTFNLNDGGDSSTSKVSSQETSSQKLSSLPAPTRTGYAFSSWNSQTSGNGDSITTSTEFDDDDTVYAQWIKLYLITFDLNGGTMPTGTGVESYTTSSFKLSSLPSPTKTDNGFVGWYYEKQTDDTDYDDDDVTKVTTSSVFTSNTTIYAHWSDNVVEEISVYSSPQVNYDIGDKINLDDLVIKQTWTDDTTNTVSFSKFSERFEVAPSTSTALVSTNTYMTITYTDEFDKEHLLRLSITVGDGSHVFSGTVVNYSNLSVASAKLTLSQGGTIKYSTTTDASGIYSFKGTTAGTYQLDISYGDHNLAYTVTIVQDEDQELNITLTDYSINTDTAFGTSPLLHVNGLVSLAKYYATSDSEDISIDFYASNIVSDEEKDLVLYNMSSADYLVSTFDISITMSHTEDGEVYNTNLSNLPTYVNFTLEIPEDYEDRDTYYVYRLHDNIVEKLTTTANSSGEKITVNDDNTVTVQAKYFSTYALAIQVGEDDDLEEQDTTGKTLTLLKVVNDQESTTVNYGGTVVATDYKPAYGTTVYIDIGANTGYTCTDVFAFDSTGEEVELSRTSTGRFYFKQGYYPVEVTVKFLGTTADTMPEDYNIFPDIPNGEYYTFAVNRMAELELMVGTNGYFRPYDTCSRGMIAVVLYSMAGRPAFTPSGSFTDVSPGDWYYTAVLWAQEAGIIGGYPDGSFRPDNSVTRQEQALMFYKYACFMPSIDTTSYVADSGYSDAYSIASWAEEAIHWVTAKKLFAGANNNFMPNDVSIRCNLAVSLLGLYNLG